MFLLVYLDILAFCNIFLSFRTGLGCLGHTEKICEMFSYKVFMAAGVKFFTP